MNSEVKRVLELALESLTAVGVPQEWDCRLRIREALEQAELAGPELVRQARETYGSDEIQIDDTAPMSRVSDGAWVQAWVWIPEHGG